MVQSGTTRGAPSKGRITQQTAVPAIIIAYVEERGQIQNGGQSSSRIDFAPPMCALPHSTPDPGGPMSRFSGASPNDQRRKPGRKQSWESLKVRLQSSRADRAAWRWQAPSGSLKKAPTFS